MRVFMAGVLVLGICNFAFAEVYKCTVDSGKTVYTDEPCGENEKILDIKTGYDNTSPGMRASEINYLTSIAREKRRQEESKKSENDTEFSQKTLGGRCANYTVAVVELFEKSNLRGDYLLCAAMNVDARKGFGKLGDGMLWEIHDSLWARFDDGKEYKVRHKTFRGIGPDRVTRSNRRFKIETCFGSLTKRYKLKNIEKIGCR